MQGRGVLLWRAAEASQATSLLRCCAWGVRVFNERQAGSRSFRSILFASLQADSEGHQANRVRQAAPHRWIDGTIGFRRWQSCTTLQQAQPAGQARGSLEVCWPGKPSRLRPACLVCGECMGDHGLRAALAGQPAAAKRRRQLGLQVPEELRRGGGRLRQAAPAGEGEWRRHSRAMSEG
jgi:hypothetical protein